VRRFNSNTEKILISNDDAFDDGFPTQVPSTTVATTDVLANNGTGTDKFEWNYGYISRNTDVTPISTGHWY
jgi:hypothetical protein